MLNEPLDESSGIQLAKRAAKPEAISFETVVPAEGFLLYRDFEVAAGEAIRRSYIADGRV